MMLTLFLYAALDVQPSPAISPSQIFQEARAAWSVEGGRTWGRSLAGPTLLVDQTTRQIWASDMDAEGRLKAQGDCFTGTLPKEVPIANTALEWAGRRWSMLMLPLPEQSLNRRIILIHESWHRIQPALGLDIADLSNGHLDKLEGRYWLQLEWRALAKALGSGGVSRRSWIAAALACRTRRQELFPQAVDSERNLELAEGLAEYTGIRVTGARRLIINKLQTAEGPYTRSFAYISGPAYGLLLDDRSPGWSRRVRRATDLSIDLQEAYRLPAATRAEAEAAAQKLGGPELRLREEASAKATQERRALATDPLTKGSTLRFPGPFRVQFNPNNTESLDDGAAYHPTATYLGDWGRLEVTGGSLRSADWSEVRVAAPGDLNARPLSGPGWRLDMTPGWTILAIEKTKSFRMSPQVAPQ